MPERSRRDLALVGLIAVAAWVIHLTAPSDQLDDDQLKPWGYVADIVLHGKWLAQVDYEGAQMSKPPLYQWLCAALAESGLGVSPLAMYLPTGLAMIGTSLLVCWMGAGWFGRRVGLAAGIAFAVSPLTVKHMCTARTDALFCFTITLGALGAWHVWESISTSRRAAACAWLLFCLGATLACLTKGPLGILLCALGLGAAVWERRRGGLTAWGILAAAIAAGVTLVWFLAAAAQAGQPLVDRMIGRELIGHALGKEAESSIPFSRAYQPFFYLVTRMPVWGVLALIGSIAWFRRPAADDFTRRAERFCICWLMLGMIMFAASTHQRADLLLPLMPAAAILGCRVADRWLSVWAARSRTGTLAVRIAWPVVAIIGLAYAAFWNHVGRLKDAQVIETRAIAAAAEKLKAIIAKDPGDIVFATGAWEAKFAFGMMVPGLETEQLAALPPTPHYVVYKVVDSAKYSSVGSVVAEPFKGGAWLIVREPVAR
jgi:4-amino-4-deoxy-L-arabinose transferase-like glycosyltransferase